MGQITEPKPVKLFVGMLAAKSEWFDEAERILIERFGPVDLASDLMEFDQTDYYRDEMGMDLERKFLSFERPIRPDDIIDVKLATNEIERDLARSVEHPSGSQRTRRGPKGGPARPVNLDPGYVEFSKVVLATTKDYSHRIYLGRGIYAEVTLAYHQGKFEPWPWTYPDYRTSAYGEFFLAVRQRLRDNLRSG